MSGQAHHPPSKWWLWGLQGMEEEAEEACDCAFRGGLFGSPYFGVGE